jgi:hypothetical protein
MPFESPASVADSRIQPLALGRPAGFSSPKRVLKDKDGPGTEAGSSLGSPAASSSSELDPPSSSKLRTERPQYLRKFDPNRKRFYYVHWETKISQWQVVPHKHVVLLVTYVTSCCLHFCRNPLLTLGRISKK